MALVSSHTNDSLQQTGPATCQPHFKHYASWVPMLKMYLVWRRVCSVVRWGCSRSGYRKQHKA